MGNVTGGKIPSHISHLKTARLGKQAYDIHGGKLDPANYLPLIIGKDEMPEYNRIMMERIKQINS